MSLKIFWKFLFILLTIIGNYTIQLKHLTIIFAIVFYFNKIVTSKGDNANDETDSDLTVLSDLNNEDFMFDPKQMERMQMDRLLVGSGVPSPLILSTDTSTQASTTIIALTTATTTQSKAESDRNLGLIIGLSVGSLIATGGLIATLALGIKFIMSRAKFSKITPSPKSLANKASNLKSTQPKKDPYAGKKRDKQSSDEETEEEEEEDNSEQAEKRKMNEPSNKKIENSRKINIKNTMTDVSV